MTGTLTSEMATAHPKIDPRNGSSVPFGYPAHGNATNDIACDEADASEKIAFEKWFEAPYSEINGADIDPDAAVPYVSRWTIDLTSAVTDFSLNRPCYIPGGFPRIDDAFPHPRVPVRIRLPGQPVRRDTFRPAGHRLGKARRGAGRCPGPAIAISDQWRGPARRRSRSFADRAGAYLHRRKEL